MGNANSGFASQTPERRRAIAALGGGSKKRDPKTRSFSADQNLAKRAGRNGGLKSRPQKITVDVTD